MLACLFCRVYGMSSLLLHCIYHALLLNVRQHIHSALPEPIISFSFHTIIIICTVIGSIHATMAHSVCWDQCKITLELRYRTFHLNWHQNDQSIVCLGQCQGQLGLSYRYCVSVAHRNVIKSIISYVKSLLNVDYNAICINTYSFWFNLNSHLVPCGQRLCSIFFNENT